jgi:hypothetical protein
MAQVQSGGDGGPGCPVMSVESVHDRAMSGDPARGGGRARSWRWVAGIIALFAAAAVLLWGPIGIGSGPLAGGGQILGQKDQAWVLLIPISAGNSGCRH